MKIPVSTPSETLYTGARGALYIASTYQELCYVYCRATGTAKADWKFPCDQEAFNELHV